MATVAQVLQEAMVWQQTGNLAAAASLYRQILAQAPEEIGVVHLLATVTQQQQDWASAIQLYQQVLTHPNPDDPRISAQITDAWNNLGTLYRETRDLSQALACYQQALARDPDFVVAWCNAAQAQAELGDLEAARDSFRQALARDPDAGQAHYGLANLLTTQQDWATAIGHYQRVLSLHPDHLPAHLALGTTYAQQGRFDDAIRQYQRARMFTPSHAGLLHNLGHTYAQAGRASEAIAHYWEALRHQPDYAEVHDSLGNLYSQQGQLDLAVVHYQQATTIRPDFVAAWVHWGMAERDRHQFDAAHRCFETAHTRDPASPLVTRQQGYTWLLQGDLSRGIPASGRDVAVPELPSLSAETTLVVSGESDGADWGLWGRFLPQVAQRVGSLILVCDPDWLSVQSSWPELAQAGCRWLTTGSPLPETDGPIVSIALDELPRLGMGLPEPLPPPLRLTAASATALPERSVPSTRRVGLIPHLDTGIPDYISPYHRCSPPPPLWSTLGSLPDLDLWVLGSEDFALPETVHLPEKTLHLTTPMAWINTLSQMDVVISIDSPWAHLAACLGIPTWILLPYTPRWYWFLERSDSPWYPSVRLFRQPRPGEWASVLETVKEALDRPLDGQ
ncbi:MAG: tetratricopeptide repeat-containing glycosyltransferase family protein [Synechococcales cyanobacterium]